MVKVTLYLMGRGEDMRKRQVFNLLVFLCMCGGGGVYGCLCAVLVETRRGISSPKLDLQAAGST